MRRPTVGGTAPNFDLSVTPRRRPRVSRAVPIAGWLAAAMICASAHAAGRDAEPVVEETLFGEPLRFASLDEFASPPAAPLPEGLPIPGALEPYPELAGPYPPFAAEGMVLPPPGMPAYCPTCGPGVDCKRCDPCWEPWYRLFDFGLHRTSAGDPGIGQERVMLAPFFMGVTQPFNNVRLEYDAVYGTETPNRSEYLWAAPPKGPQLPEREVDYIDLRLVSELAPGDAFSIETAIPLRSLDPEINPNTTGFGDMSVTTKIKLVDGRYWQFSQIMKTDINTGSARKGLGTGHVSLEPGVLGRYEWNSKLYFHGRLAYWIPLGGDPTFSGPAINWGLGASYVAYETDTFAAIPTFEMIGWSFLDGAKTLPNGEVTDVDGDGTISLLPGTRFVLGPAGDLGLFEVGVAGGLGYDDDGWFDGIFRTELRWSY